MGRVFSAVLLLSLAVLVSLARGQDYDDDNDDTGIYDSVFHWPGSPASLASTPSDAAAAVASQPGAFMGTLSVPLQDPLSGRTEATLGVSARSAPATGISTSVVRSVNSALDTSIFPLWAIVVASIGGAMMLLGIVLLIVGAVRRLRAQKNGDYENMEQPARKPTRTPFVLAALLLVFGAILIAVSLGIALSTPVATPFGNVARGTKVELTNARVVVQVFDSWPRALTRTTKTARHSVSKKRLSLAFRDRKNREVRVKVADQGARIPANLKTARAAPLEFDLPPVNRAFSGSAYVAHDGSLVVESWTASRNTRSANAADPTLHRLGIFILSFSTLEACGTVAVPENCTASCNVDSLKDLLYRSPTSVAAFYATATNNKVRFVTTDSDVYFVTIPAVCNDINEIPELVTAATGVDYSTRYEHRSYYLPTNWKRLSNFATGSIGMGEVGGSLSWMIDCEKQTLIHELGHNLGLGHAGAQSSDGSTFMEYYDFSSDMSASLVEADPAVAGPAYRGFAASQLAFLNVFGEAQIATLTGDTASVQLQPLSALSTTGFLAGRVVLPNGTTLWVEMRSKAAMDAELGDALSVTQVQGSYVGTILVKEAYGNMGTKLLAILPVGQSATIYGVTVTHTQSSIISVQFSSSAAATTTPSTAGATTTTGVATTTPAATMQFQLLINPYTNPADALTWTDVDGMSLVGVQTVARAWLSTHTPYSANVEGYLASVVNLMEGQMRSRGWTAYGVPFATTTTVPPTTAPAGTVFEFNVLISGVPNNPLRWNRVDCSNRAATEGIAVAWLTANPPYNANVAGYTRGLADLMESRMRAAGWTGYAA